ncbi:MAG: hypothetical protein IJW00_02980 [Clostridia bacterium]|nr:hypothetical protein [Clostridia bacterium]
MKQTIKRMLCGLLIATLVLPIAISLTSCSDTLRLNTLKEPERAVEFVNILNKRMESQNSYVAEMEANIVMELYRTEISMTATGTEIVYGQGSSDYFTQTETHQVMTVNGSKTEMTTIEGFADGKMFYYSAGNGVRTVKLWSALSCDDYVAFDKTYNTTDGLDDDIMASEAATRTCIQNDDKTWTATYTDYTAEGLKAFESIMSGLDSYMKDVRMADVMVTVTASADLLPSSMEMEFVFEPVEEGDDVELPTMSAKAVYKDIGTTEAVEVDLTNYDEVVDLRVVTIVEKSLQDFLNADTAEFKVVTTQNVKVSGQTSNSTETDEGSFEMGESGYTFDIDARVGFTKYDITYKDEVYRIMKGDQKQSQKYWTEAEARAYIKGLLDPSSFSDSIVRNIEKDEEASTDGKAVYLIKIKTPDLTQYESALGGVNLSGVATMKVTIEDGRMTEQYYELSMSAGNQYKIVVTATCTYISYTETD